MTVTAGAGLLACATQSTTDETTSTPGTAGPQNGGGATVGAPQSGSKCEELGDLSAPALSGTFDTTESPESETTSFTLANRPVASKVKVVAVGAPSTLVGSSAVLGASVNGSYATCTHCVVVAIGCTATSCAGAALFFPRGGAGTFTAVGQKRGQPFAGKFTDVTLEQVTIDPVTLASIPVVNGACMHLSSLTFNAMLEGGDPVDAGTSDEGGQSDSGGGGLLDGGVGTSGGTSGGHSSTSSGGESTTQKTGANSKEL